MQKTIGFSPHVRGKDTTSGIMRDVMIALLPAGVAAVYFFGLNALVQILLCVGTAVATEAIIQRCIGKPVTVNDLSAAVTGFLLALNLPSGVPFYIPVVGAVFAIAIVKQCFGGLGCNFVYPALAARAFLLISFPVAMTTWVMPGNVDAVASATPLAAMAAGEAVPSLTDMFIGNIAGCLGETSALALLIGGVYLLIRRVITAIIPVCFLGMIAGISAIVAAIEGDPSIILYHLLAGGAFIGAFFMATDYVTSPSAPKAQVIFGLGCGGVTMVIRLFGGYPEGVSFAILFMNLLVPLLDKKFAPRARALKGVAK